MGSLHHANARTTARIRKEIQDSKETIAALAERYHVNFKTILRWKNADSIEDGKSGPKEPRSTVLTEAEEQVICEFRKITRFSLDDVYVSLRDNIPTLTRSNLHRCLKRHGLNRLPDDEQETPREKKKFKDYEIGYVHIDITELKISGKKLYLFVGIDRICKYAYVELHERMTAEIARSFLEALIEDFPFRIHTILTDNGAQFTYELLAEHLRPKGKAHIFDRACEAHGVRHKLTKFRHPWTNGQVEAFNKTIKLHTTKAYHYDSIEELRKHLMAFRLVYNFQRPLKSLKYKPPYQVITETYHTKPHLFTQNIIQKTMGLNSFMTAAMR